MSWLNLWGAPLCPLVVGPDEAAPGAGCQRRLAFVAGMAASADAAIRKRSKSIDKNRGGRRRGKEPIRKDGFVDIPTGVLQIAIRSAASACRCRDACASPVAGFDRHGRPPDADGRVQRHRRIASTARSLATHPCFFMQRVTWSGVAMHEGMLPGLRSLARLHSVAASSRRARGRPPLGVRVIIRGELAPVDFQHPSLFAPAPKPAQPKVAMMDLPTAPSRVCRSDGGSHDHRQ